MNHGALFVAMWVVLGMGGVKAQERTMDLSRLVASLDLTERGAGRWLETLEAGKGGPSAERLIVVTTTGERLIERAGTQSSVRVDAVLDELLLRPGRSVVLIHNHPSNAGLSAADVGQLSRPGVAAVVALAHDGSIFIASPGARMNPDVLESRQYILASGEVTKRLRAARPSGGVTTTASDAHFSHLVTLALAKAGVIEYWYVLRGASRGSFEAARVTFGQVTEGAAGRLRKGN